MPDRAYPWVAVTSALVSLALLGLLTAAAAVVWLQTRKLRRTLTERDVAREHARLWERTARAMDREVRRAGATPDVWAQLADVDRLGDQIVPLYPGGAP